MPRYSLKLTLLDFKRELKESRRIAIDAYEWASVTIGVRQPLISRKRRDSMTELAFLRIFLAWENFLEQSFVLLLSGQKPPKGHAPKRHSFPPSVKVAMDWVIPEEQRYAKWTTASVVSNRAERFFREGRPFTPILRSNQSTLEECKILRNAIAHASANTQIKFETLVRRKIGVLPSNLSVGSFLGTLVPGTRPPLSFLENYMSKIEFAADQILSA